MTYSLQKVNSRTTSTAAASRLHQCRSKHLAAQSKHQGPQNTCNIPKTPCCTWSRAPRLRGSQPLPPWPVCAAPYQLSQYPLGKGSCMAGVRGTLPTLAVPIGGEGAMPFKEGSGGRPTCGNLLRPCFLSSRAGVQPCTCRSECQLSLLPAPTQTPYPDVWPPRSLGS